MSKPCVQRLMLVVFLGISAVVTRAREQAPGQEELLVVGYLPEYRIKSFEPQRTGPLTDIVLFSVEPREDGSLDTSRLSPWIGDPLRALQSQTQVRWHLCVGGGGRSQGFSTMAAKESTRRRFISEVLKLCKTHRLTGIDLDWEHPETPEDIEAHGQLLKDLRDRAQPSELSLSMAVAAWQTLSPLAKASVDRVHLMAYNAGGPHATYERAISDIDRLVRQGVPAEKICLGIPFYGREIEGERRTMTYGEIVERHAPSPLTNEIGGYFFNGRSMVSRKVRLARDRHLGGIMIWEIGQDSRDASRSLLRAVGDELSR